MKIEKLELRTGKSWSGSLNGGTVCALVLAGFFILRAGSADAGNYLNSAHGSNSSGVNRTVLADYARGNCAHCHEMHASIGGGEPDPVDGAASPYAVFAPTDTTSQSDNFCLKCHQSAGGSKQSGVITNNNYAATFGGGAAVTTTIYAAFNPSSGSSHNLGQISTKMQASFGGTFSAAANPCTGCHNPHLAKKNNATGASYDPTKAAISRPTDHNNLWGDDAGERMLAYVGANTYRAPFFVGANAAANPTLHEPDGVSRDIASQEVGGSTTPDYDTFCLDCHSVAIGAITAIPWDAGGGNLAQHGQASITGGGQGNRNAPYTLDGTSGTAEDTATNFVLSCLDCHEPHGSQVANGQYLLRTTVNGVTNITFGGAGQWYNFCAACHDLSFHAGVHPAADCTSCHSHSNFFGGF